MEKLIFRADDEELELEVIEQTTLGGVSYILAQNDEEAFILKNVSDDGEQGVYEFVNDDEMNIVSKIFSELLDIEFES